MTTTVGISFSHHDLAISVVVDGEVRFALAKERLTRLKHDGLIWGGCNGDVSELLQTALRSAGICESSIDAVGVHHIDHLPKSALIGCLPTWLLAVVPVERIFSVSHHLGHALSAFFLSPFDQAAVLVVDGGGGPFFDIKPHCDDRQLVGYSDNELILQELTPVSYQPNRERESFFSFRGLDITAHRRIIGSETYTGIAGNYGRITEVIFGDPLDSGKTMGLSTFGQPQDNLSFLELMGDAPRAFRSAWARRADFNSHREGVEAGKVTHGRDYENNTAAVTLAASLQRAFEEAMLEYVRWLKNVSGLSKLILVGGGALNCCSNRRISLEAGFDDVFIPACPGDDGIAIGGAVFAAAALGDGRRASRGTLPYWGGDIAEYPCITHNRTLVSADSTLDYLADRLAHGKVVGWCQGRSEFGPRALGHRSLLADPRDPESKERLNRTIKRREMFRPFAPIVLDTAVDEFFSEVFPSRFMSFVGKLREDKCKLVPAAAHVDGTARYQILSRADNPAMYDLIERFAALTGVPMVLNTSFNEAGEPLVETPEQAFRFLDSGRIDYLAIGDKIFGQSFVDESRGDGSCEKGADVNLCSLSKSEVS